MTRILIVVFVVIIASITSLYTYILRKTVIESSIKITEMQSDLGYLRAQYDSLRTVTETRLIELERIVLGELPAEIKQKQRPITSSALWMANRDKEFRDRLSKIEKRLMTLESDKK